MFVDVYMHGKVCLCELMNLAKVGRLCEVLLKRLDFMSLCVSVRGRSLSMKIVLLLPEEEVILCAGSGEGGEGGAEKRVRS